MAASHSFNVLSLPDSNREPSGEKATPLTQPGCSKVRSRIPEAVSHSLSVPSILPDSSCLPSAWERPGVKFLRATRQIRQLSEVEGTS